MGILIVCPRIEFQIYILTKKVSPNELNNYINENNVSTKASASFNSKIFQNKNEFLSVEKLKTTLSPDTLWLHVKQKNCQTKLQLSNIYSKNSPRVFLTRSSMKYVNSFFRAKLLNAPCVRKQVKHFWYLGTITFQYL